MKTKINGRFVRYAFYLIVFIIVAYGSFTRINSFNIGVILDGLISVGFWHLVIEGFRWLIKRFKHEVK